ncbi:MAG: DNA-binding protein [Candidatus Anstonellaceae archaeon]
MEAEEEDIQAAYQRRLQQIQADLRKKELLRRMLSDKAYERMMNVRLSNPELYEKVVASIAYIAQSGGAMGKISEEQILTLLSKLAQRRETKIEFRSK